MTFDEQLGKMMLKWATDSEGLRAEARRLEYSDLSRHATSIAMLEARAQAIDRCMVEVQTIRKS